ncbi:hypothetical protein IFM89_034799 [Coptis chinensis]|uniref:Uncharacterized protein n=1 Tax=Coptis chinensis TaxID=261450 RepID=A0A835H8V0_9MAGN|nr:hypothetical protein IFM89_034799 [Coptis chinensis]
MYPSHIIIPRLDSKPIMDPVVDKVKGLLKWSENLFHHKTRRNPIEILKRLQRESFSDIMKLRDRQEKFERMVSFYKSTKGSPFEELGTHVHGMVDLVGALLFVDSVDQETCGTLNRAGMRSGLNSRFIFETSVREKDRFLAEFVGQGSSDSPLSLAKVMYSANVSDWLSAVALPCGARCKDVAITSNPFSQEQNLTEFSSFGPPILNQCHGAAVGVMVKRENIAASLAELVSGVGLQPDAVGIRHFFSTFGQVIYKLSKGTTLTVLGIHRRLRTRHQQVRLRKFTIPVGSLRRREVLGALDAPASPITMNTEDKENDGSIALMLESELDESTRVGGWVEMQNSNSRCLQWAVSMSDTPEDELGWGLSLGGTIQGPSTWDHFQVEAFLKFNMGKRCSLQPGIVYVMDEDSLLESSFRSRTEEYGRDDCQQLYKGSDVPFLKDGACLEIESNGTSPWSLQSSHSILPSVSTREHNLINLLSKCNEVWHMKSLGTAASGTDWIVDMFYVTLYSSSIKEYLFPSLLWLIIP